MSKATDSRLAAAAMLKILARLRGSTGSPFESLTLAPVQAAAMLDSSSSGSDQSTAPTEAYKKAELPIGVRRRLHKKRYQTQSSSIKSLYIDPSCLGFGIVCCRPQRTERVLDLFQPPLSVSSTDESLISEKGWQDWSRNAEIRDSSADKLHHLVLTWKSNPPNREVYIVGTFTNPVWVVRLPLFWCPRNELHWIDIHEINPHVCGVHQFKFIVDGVWKCDPSQPICDDGSEHHYLNNVTVIFPRRLRLRLSTRRFQGSVTLHSNQSPPQSMIVPEDDQSLLRIPSWACRSTLQPDPLAASTTPAALSRNKLETRWRLLPPSQPPTSKPPIVAGVGPASAQQTRPWLIAAAQEHTPTCAGPLTRCMSYHGGRRERKSSRESNTKLTNWPSYVTSSLHNPDLLLQLLLPTNVVKTKHLTLSSGWSMAPHPEKVQTGGADSFFISSDHQCMALADGVGEWDQFGFCPRTFADELMAGVAAVWENKSHPIHQLKSKLPPSEIAKELMRLAHAYPKTYGSATCCIAVFDETRGLLGVSNLGDSGLCTLRRERRYQMTEKFKTSDRSHFFNCPYQLTRSPPADVLAKLFGLQNVEKGKGLVLPSEDLPKHSRCYDVPLEEGDLILMASDGLWDNLWSHEVRALCNLALAPIESLILHDATLTTTADEVARALAEAATFRSQDPTARTPFATSYTHECGMPAFTGGKCDDITVLAAWAQRHSPEEEEEEEEILDDDTWIFAPQRWPYKAASEADSDFETDEEFIKSPRGGGELEDV